MSFGFQPLHLVVIFLAALVIFGPKNLPEVRPRAWREPS